MSGVLNLLLAGAASAIKDAYFNLTTLLLNTSSTNGAQNNTFLDSSTNNFSITRNGNTTQGTFTPFSQTGWGNYFDGTDDRLTTSSALLAYSTGNASTQTATIEAMVYLNAYNASKSGADENAAIVAKGSTYMNFGINHLGNLILYHYDGSVRTPTSSGTVPLNTWTHVAVTLSGGVVTFYINGSSSGTGTWYGLAATSDPVYIGEATGASASAINGYLSNLRISTTARTISVPTVPYTSDASTALLTCQSNRFVDNSSNGYAVTVSTGTPSVQAFSPFAPTAAYDAAVVGGSGYFDGTGDWLNTATSSNFVTSGDFTMEAWAYNTGRTNNYQGIISQRSSSGGPAINTNNTGTIEFQFGGTVMTTVTMPVNQWFHVAISRSGSGSNNISIYLNGTRIAQATNTGSTTTNNIAIGRYYTDLDDYYWLGYIASARYTTSAVYSGATITVPTAPVTAISNTQLLLNFTNAGIYDSAAKNVLETVGNAQVSTTQAKWGTTSMYFDGTGDYLRGNANLSNSVAFGKSDFTIELWVYCTSISAGTSDTIIDARPGASTGDSFLFYLWDGGKIAWFVPSLGNYIVNTGAVSANTWTHVAICRSGSTLRSFKDGVLQQSGTDNVNYMNPGSPYPFIGSGYFSGDFFRGYMDDLRISRYARYTANFTPPAAALPTQ